MKDTGNHVPERGESNARHAGRVDGGRTKNSMIHQHTGDVLFYLFWTKGNSVIP